MDTDKQIKSIERSFSEGAHKVTLHCFRNVGQLNEIKEQLEKTNYQCNISHETYLTSDKIWPYQMEIIKQIKSNN